MKASTLQYYKERVLRVLVYLQERLDQPLSLDELARRAGISPCHFHHVFTGMVGETPMGHVRRLRLERAAWRLKATRLSIVELALEAGYDTHEAFTRAFRAVFELSPSEYRRRRSVPAWRDAGSGVHFREGRPPRHFKTTRFGETIMNITLKQFPALRVAFVRHVGPYEQCGAAWERLCLALGREGLLGGDTQFIGISHDDPEVTPPAQRRYDACVTVDERFQPQGDVGVQTIAGGPYAVLTHQGPYEGLSDSYAALMGQWLPRSGRRPRPMPCVEYYLNTPENTAPEDLLTDICLPLEPESPLP